MSSQQVETQSALDSMFVHYSNAAMDLAGGELDATVFMCVVMKDGSTYFASSVRTALSPAEADRLAKAATQEIKQQLTVNTHDRNIR